jgi:hypothetical protein
MSWKDIFKNPFKKKVQETVTDADREAFVRVVTNTPKKEKVIKPKYTEPVSYTISGVEYKIGDKVICRSNEPDPLWVGKIVSFWDNHGRWTNATPQIRNVRSGKIYGFMGAIRPYSNELMVILREMKPLEQWNYLIPEELRYTKDEIKRKEDNYLKRKMPKRK